MAQKSLATRLLLPDLDNLLGEDLVSDQFLLEDRRLEALESYLELDTLADSVHLVPLLISRDHL